MYLKLIIGGLLGGTIPPCRINGFVFYDNNNNPITGLNANTNVISSNYNTNNTPAYQNLWFSPIWDTESTPYFSGGVHGQEATIILKINTSQISKIMFYNAWDVSTASYINIYSSIDNINYTFSETINFTSTQQIKYTTKSIIYTFFLIQDDNTLCITDGSTLTNVSVLPYTINSFNSYGMKNVSLINKSIISLIKNQEFNIGLLK